MNISTLSVKRPTLVVVVFSVLVFLGFMSMQSLNYELLPKFSPPIFTVSAAYPGASPQEVENSLTRSIEEAVSGLPNVKTIQSVSREGVATVMVELTLDADLDEIMNEAIRKINAVQGDWPEAVREPAVSKISVNDRPVLSAGVRADMTAPKLYDELNYLIAPELAKIPGVGEVNLVGGSEREIQVNLHRDKLDAYNLLILNILQAIQSSNQEFPSGKIQDPENQMLLRMSVRFTNVEDIKNLTVARLNDGSLVTLKDIAEVRDTEKEPSTLFRVNGEQSVGIEVKKKDDANTVSVSERVKTELDNIEKQYASANMQFNIQQDSSIFILDAVRSVTHDLLLAIVLVTVIMILFLHSFRNAVIVMLAVPLSIITSFIGMQLMGFTLNLMTLMALSLVVGTLVDDAIVVLENIYRHLEMGKNRWQATLDGIKEIGLSVLSITLVLVVVFFPVALSESIIAPIIRPFAMVIVISVMISLLVAFTVVPLLTSRFSKLERIKTTSFWGKLIAGFERGIDRFADYIQGMLVWAFRHWVLSLTMVAALLAGSVGLLGGGFIDSEFIGSGDMGEAILNIEYPRDYTIRQNNLVIQEIEKRIRQKPEVVNLYTTVGSSGSVMGTSEANYKSQVTIKLTDKDQRSLSSKQFVKELEQELNATIPGVKVRSSIVTMVGADEDPIQVVFRASNTDRLYAFAERMKKQVSEIPGATNVKLSIEKGSPEVVIKVDKDRMAQLDLSLETVGPAIQTAFSGNTDSKFRKGDYEYDINIRLDAFNRQSVSDVKNLTFLNQHGQTVKLEQFADITMGTGPANLERYNRISSITLLAQPLGRGTGGIGADVQHLLDTTDLPAGVSYALESDLKMQEGAFGSLGTALIIAIFLVYLIMVALYESYLHPFVILFSIPLSVIGALLALALAQETLSIFTMLGIFTLVGLVTKNAILVVDFTNTLRKEGHNILRALLTAVNLRLRPVLMTAISMVVGMLPLALSQGAGAAWKTGLGWVLIGGMSSSMLLTLIIVPVIYLLTDRIKVWIGEHIFKRTYSSSPELTSQEI